MKNNLRSKVEMHLLGDDERKKDGVAAKNDTFVDFVKRFGDSAVELG